MIVKCVFVKGRQVISASEFLKEQVAIESGLVDAVHRSKATDYFAEIIDCFGSGETKGRVNYRRQKVER